MNHNQANAHLKETDAFLRTILRPTRVVDAHCDIPCGVYDPEQARIEAESCLRIIEKYEPATTRSSGHAASTSRRSGPSS